MKSDLPILSWAAAGLRPEGIAGPRGCPLPPPGLHPRKARLPGLAGALADLALARPGVPWPASVLFGSALGCLTETGAFVENRIRNDEALPLPRAFSASVHNAVASRLAMSLEARGENTTFVHGEVSFHQAVLAAALLRRRRPGETILAGGADETTEWVVRARESCGVAAATDEGGGLVLIGDPSPAAPALAMVREVALGRPRSLREWLSRRLGDGEVDVVAVISGDGIGSLGPAVPPGMAAVDGRDRAGGHSSAAAAMTALAAGLLAGEADAATLGLPGVPRKIAVVAVSRLGDAGLLILERAP